MNGLIEALQETDSLSETAAEQFYSYAYAQYTGGDWMKAADVFWILCARRPLEPRFWFGLSASLQEAKVYETAMRTWAMTALLEKENPYPHFHAAECALSLKRVEEASLALQEAQKRVFSETHPLQEAIETLQERWNL